MSKRPAEGSEKELDQLKGGERPLKARNDNDAIDFEDEFEDEFDSEDEIFEAGRDGRPDEENETEESRGMWITLKT
jgi:ribosome assembly protein RRB1